MKNKRVTETQNSFMSLPHNSVDIDTDSSNPPSYFQHQNQNHRNLIFYKRYNLSKLAIGIFFCILLCIIFGIQFSQHNAYRSTEEQMTKLETEFSNVKIAVNDLVNNLAQINDEIISTSSGEFRNLNSGNGSFQDAAIYKFYSVPDGCILDLFNGMHNSGYIQTFKPHGKSNQQWLATKAAKGWRLTTMVTTAEKKCIDNEVTSNYLISATCDGDDSQHWYPNEISPGSFIYTLINISKGKALTNHGCEKKVTLENLNTRDRFQQWRIERV